MIPLEKISNDKYRNVDHRLVMKRAHCGVWFVKVNGEHRYQSRSFEKCLAWLKDHLTNETGDPILKESG